MTVTFEQARGIADAALRPDWPDAPAAGTFMVAAWGFENDALWVIVAGAREHLLDRDDDFMVMDWPSVLVEKATGRLERVPFDDVPPDVWRRPVGSNPALSGEPAPLARRVRPTPAERAAALAARRARRN